MDWIFLCINEDNAYNLTESENNLGSKGPPVQSSQIDNVVQGLVLSGFLNLQG